MEENTGRQNPAGPCRNPFPGASWLVLVKYALVTQEVAIAYYLGNMEPLLAALELETN